MADFQLVDPQGWEWDLQSVYSAYMNHFQLHNVPWYDRSWGHLFTSFEAFLAFGWPVIVITDSSTGRAHIVTRMNSVGAFLKMIKTRFGESLPTVSNMLRVTPFETHTRHLRTVSDSNSYKKIHGTLSASILAAQKLRVRTGELRWVQELWEKRDKTFLAVDFEWSERNTRSCLEWGYAAVRCGHLDAMGVWPPVPAINYRKGHFIVSEYVDKVHNKQCPTFPWEYAFGDSQVIPKAKVGEILQATISSLASPDSETLPNQLILVAHGVESDLDWLADLKVKLPNNVLVIDTAAFERRLFANGQRGAMIDTHTNKPRQPGTTLSLKNTLGSLNADLGCTWHCSGNDAFGTLLALQLLLQPKDTQLPVVRPVKRGARHNHAPGITVHTNLGPGYLTPTSWSPGAVSPSRPTSGHVEESEAPTYNRSPQGQERVRSPGRGIRQEQQVHACSSFIRDGTKSTTAIEATDTEVQGRLRSGGRVSKRSSLVPMEVPRPGANRLSHIAG